MPLIEEKCRCTEDQTVESERPTKRHVIVPQGRPTARTAALEWRSYQAYTNFSQLSLPRSKADISAELRFVRPTNWFGLPGSERSLIWRGGVRLASWTIMRSYGGRWGTGSPSMAMYDP